MESHSFRIMIVDDHPKFREMVKALLQQPGTEFVECQDGNEAVQLYPFFEPHIVLMDVAMKGLDGLTAARLLTGAYPGARVFMLTQYDDPELRTSAAQAGATGYLLKDDLSQMLSAMSREIIAWQANHPPTP